jgi:hypothetical protein
MSISAKANYVANLISALKRGAISKADLDVNNMRGMFLITGISACL